VGSMVDALDGFAVRVGRTLGPRLGRQLGSVLGEMDGFFKGRWVMGLFVDSLVGAKEGSVVGR